jgi:VIT1/CCC1 family predicted Fe2+/Mn2+ transporter
MQTPDRDRLRRLRDAQLATRDPQIKQRKLQRTIAEKHRRAARPFTWGKFWSEVPHRWRGLVFGGLVGVLIAVALPFILPSPWATVLAAIAFVFCAAFGLLLGRAIDSRENLKDLVR